MSYTWSVPTFLPSDQNLGFQGQKTDFTPFEASCRIWIEVVLSTATVSHGSKY